MCDRVIEWSSDRSNEWTNERTNERTNEWTNERMNGWMKRKSYKIIVSISSHGLLLLSVNVEERHTGLHASEGLVEETNFLARRSKHQRLGLQMRFDEREQQFDLLVKITQYITLHLWWKQHSITYNRLGGGEIIIGVNIHVHGVGENGGGDVFYSIGNSGRI